MADTPLDPWFMFELGIILALMATAVIPLWHLYRWRHRNDVYDIRFMRSGDIRVVRSKPPEGGAIRDDDGDWVVTPDTRHSFKRHGAWVHKEGDSYPIRLETNRVFSEIEDKKTGEKKTVVQEITNAQTAHISERELATIERARTFAQIYGGAPLITLLLIVILVLVFIGIVVNVVH